MERLKKRIYRIYKRLQHLSVVATSAQYLYQSVLPLLGLKEKSYHYVARQEAPLEMKRILKKDISQIKIAIVCDEMTFRGFEEECQCFFVTPSNWMRVFREQKPDLFFCESTWHGIDQYYDSWRGKVYKAGKVRFENRKELMDILNFCHRSHIPTVFWNKEDPTYFGNEDYNFVDTALKFDYIYTTAEECVQGYKDKGHQRVGVLMFGFSPKLFNPIGRQPSKEEVVFAGSWYNDQADRCKDMKRLFETVIKEGLKLKIYDRHWNSNNPIHQFPAQYKQYVHKGVGFNELSNVLKETQYAININTVKDSKSMFARRVFEMMASNIILISNESVGMKQLFKNRVWFINEAFDVQKIEEIARENLEDVFLNHTCKQRLIQIATEVGVLEKQNSPLVFVIYNHKDKDSVQHFNQLDYHKKIGLIKKGNQFYRMNDGRIIKEKAIEVDNYIYYAKELEYIPKLEFMMTQFSYVEDDYGIGVKGVPYEIIESTDNYDTLFKGNMLEVLQKDIACVTKKAII